MEHLIFAFVREISRYTFQARVVQVKKNLHYRVIFEDSVPASAKHLLSEFYTPDTNVIELFPENYHVRMMKIANVLRNEYENSHSQSYT